MIAGDPERSPGDLTGIEERDHQHRPHVVHDGQCREEDLESTRGARRDQRQHAERKRDIGRHRNRPSARLDAAAVGEEIDRSGDHHSADGAGDRQRRLPQRCQLAGQHLPLDLQPDQEKEDRHQAVVDPLMEGEREQVPAAADDDRGRPQALIDLCPPGICRTKRDARARDEQRAGGRSVRKNS